MRASSSSAIFQTEASDKIYCMDSKTNMLVTGLANGNILVYDVRRMVLHLFLFIFSFHFSLFRHLSYSKHGTPSSFKLELLILILRVLDTLLVGLKDVSLLSFLQNKKMVVYNLQQARVNLRMR